MKVFFDTYALYEIVKGNPDYSSYLDEKGFDVSYIGVDRYGLVSPKDIQKAIRKDTILISIMFANNETGVIFPVEEIGKIAKGRNIVFHTDAVQAAGKIPFNVKKLNIDIAVISGHKLYAPKGIGATYLKRGVRLTPLIHGGHHERNRRAGTENVAGIAAIGKACEIAVRDMKDESERKYVFAWWD